MDGHPAPSLKDEEIQILIDWLGTKDALGKQGIILVTTVLESLRQDRQLLVQALEAKQNV